MSNMLKRERNKHYYSQTEIAKKLGLAISTYNMYENEKRRVPKDTAEKICKLLDCKVDDIFYPATYKILNSEGEKCQNVK